MDVIGWLMLGLGLVFLMLGLIAMVGRVSGLPRHDGREPLAAGVGFCLFAVSRVPALPAKEWLAWAGAACVVTGAVVAWRSHRRTHSTGRAQGTDPAQ